MIGFLEVVGDQCVFGWGVGGPSFVITRNRKKIRRRRKRSKKRKLTKTAWDAASDLQLKNRIEKKIKEIEKKKK